MSEIATWVTEQQLNQKVFNKSIGKYAYTVENDEDKKALLDYIRAGIDVDFSQIILTSLWLYQQREENTQDN